MIRDKEMISYKELVIFFFPIALSAILMMSSHSIISSALARTSNAEISLAAFSVASSIAMLFESPCFNIRQMVIALADDKGSLKSIAKVGFLVFMTSVSLMVLVAFTRLGEIVFINIAGVRDSMYQEVITSFRLLMILPILSATRAYFQGVLIIKKRTFWLTINVSVRLVFMLIISAFILTRTNLDNSSVGVIIFASGMAMEALLTLITGGKLLKGFPKNPSKFKSALTVKEAGIFFAPLIIASFSQTLARPSINAGLARLDNPDLALASFQVAYSYAMIFIVLLFYIHQLILVYAKDKESYRVVRRFILSIGLGVTIILLISGLTPIGDFVLRNIIGVESQLAEESLRTIASYSLIPLVLAANEMLVGVLLKAKRTIDITIGKIINIILVVSSSLVLSALFPALGGVLASISFTIGFIFELTYFTIRSKKHMLF